MSVNNPPKLYLPARTGDMTAAIAAHIPDVKLGQGSHDISSGLTIDTPAVIQGLGKPDLRYNAAFVEMTTDSATETPLTLTDDASGSTIEKLGIRNTGASAPTAGEGINALLDEGSFVLRDVHVNGFYDGALLGGRGFIVDGLVVTDVGRYGVRIGNETSDHGLGVLQNCFIYAGPNRLGDDAVGLRWENGGGLRVEHLKIGQFNQPNSLQWKNAIEIHIAADVSTTELEFGDCVIDEFTDTGIKVTADTGGNLNSLRFNDLLIGQSGNPLRAIDIDGGSTLQLLNVVIDNALIKMSRNASTTAGIFIDNCSKVTLSNIEMYGVGEGIPFIQLGSGVYSANVDLRNLSYSTTGATWPAGSQAVLLKSTAPKNNVSASNGVHEYSFGWPAPNLTSSSVYQDLWKIEPLDSLVVEFVAFFRAPGGNHTTTVQRRILRLDTTDTNAVVEATVNTDVTSPASKLDVQWSVSGNVVTISAKRNSAVSADLTTGHSMIRVLGSPGKVTAIS